MGGIRTHNFSGYSLMAQVVVNPTTIRSRQRRFLVICISYINIDTQIAFMCWANDVGAMKFCPSALGWPNKLGLRWPNDFCQQCLQCANKVPTNFGRKIWWAIELCPNIICQQGTYKFWQKIMVGQRWPIHDPIMNQRYQAISLSACDLIKEIQRVCNSFTFEFQLHTEFLSIKVLKKNKLYIVMPIIISHIHVSHMLLKFLNKNLHSYTFLKLPL